jgi:hypothetical protein
MAIAPWFLRFVAVVALGLLLFAALYVLALVGWMVLGRSA